MSKKIIVRVKGGLGNQLFGYAAARRLALINNAELVIDSVTGFIRDRKFRRQYALDQFNIPCRKATPSERMEPFERYRRGLAKWLARKRSFEKRRYIEQEGENFDFRLLTVRPGRTLYLDGLWLSERYFEDVALQIRNDLCMKPPTDQKNLDMGASIRHHNAVALHVRCKHNMSLAYYLRAMNWMRERVENPHFFLFSDDPETASRALSLFRSEATTVSHNAGDDTNYADLWLMMECRHFIIANSTFSWWGAWLAKQNDKLVLAPSYDSLNGTIRSLAAATAKNWIEI